MTEPTDDEALANIRATVAEWRKSALAEPHPRRTCPGCFACIYDGAAEQGWCCDCYPSRHKYEKEAYGY